jgi:4-hydroxy-2-oxoheptanedioate aldolase
MKTNHVRAKLKSGEPSVGTWLTLPDPVAARLMGRVGFDWLTVELEHAPINIETATQSFAVIAASGTAPLARPPWNTAENIKRVLDNGAWGVILPMVNTRAEAEAAVDAARYQPRGSRSVGGQLHAASFDTDPATYYARANDEILVVAMIEHIKAVENADAILSVPGLDAFFIGPNDLTNSMGRKPVFDCEDQQWLDALKHLQQVGKKYGIASGIHVLDAAAAQRRIAEGFQLIAITSEAGMMLAKARETVQALGLAPDRPAVAKY